MRVWLRGGGGGSQTKVSSAITNVDNEYIVRRVLSYRLVVYVCYDDLCERIVTTVSSLLPELVC